MVAAMQLRGQVHRLRVIQLGLFDHFVGVVRHRFSLLMPAPAPNCETFDHDNSRSATPYRPAGRASLGSPAVALRRMVGRIDVVGIVVLPGLAPQRGRALDRAGGTPRAVGLRGIAID